MIYSTSGENPPRPGSKTYQVHHCRHSPELRQREINGLFEIVSTFPASKSRVSHFPRKSETDAGGISFTLNTTSLAQGQPLHEH